MYIDEFITPPFACSGVSIGSAVRKGPIIISASNDICIERILIEFENEHLAEDFERALELGRARIVIDEDTSIDAVTWTNGLFEKRFETSLLAAMFSKGD